MSFRSYLEPQVRTQAGHGPSVGRCHRHKAEVQARGSHRARKVDEGAAEAREHRRHIVSVHTPTHARAAESAACARERARRLQGSNEAPL